MAREPVTSRALVFDLDGTLIDSLADIASALSHALVTHGLAPVTSTEVARLVGDGARRLVARATGQDAESDVTRAVYASFVAYYAAHPAVHSTLLPGARSALALPWPRALCTNKSRAATDAVLAALDLTSCFDAIVAGDDLPVHKPDPGPLLHLATLLGVAPRELVMIGDGAQDVGAGRAAGARTVGVRGGLQGDAPLLAAGPDVVIGSLSELASVLGPAPGRPGTRAN